MVGQATRALNVRRERQPWSMDRRDRGPRVVDRAMTLCAYRSPWVPWAARYGWRLAHRRDRARARAVRSRVRHAVGRAPAPSKSSAARCRRAPSIRQRDASSVKAASFGGVGHCPAAARAPTSTRWRGQPFEADVPSRAPGAASPSPCVRGRILRPPPFTPGPSRRSSFHTVSASTPAAGGCSPPRARRARGLDERRSRRRARRGAAAKRRRGPGEARPTAEAWSASPWRAAAVEDVGTARIVVRRGRGVEWSAPSEPPRVLAPTRAATTSAEK